MLTQFAIQRASPREKSYKLADGNGLFLLVQPNGKKHWRFRYFFAGQENRLSDRTKSAIGEAPNSTKFNNQKNPKIVKIRKFRNLKKFDCEKMAKTGVSRTPV